MKLFLCLLYITTINFQCASNKEVKKNYFNNEKNTVIKYKNHTRGYYKEYIFTKKRIKIYLNYQKTQFLEKDITPEMWQKCIDLVANLNLDEFKKLKSPSNIRQTDGVQHGELSLEIKDKNFKHTCYFDHGNPPAQLKDLVNYLLSISDMDSKKNKL